VKKYIKKLYKNVGFKLQYLYDFYLYLNSLNLRNQIDKELVIVSASDENFFESLLQFINSVIKYEPKALLVIYNLGMSDEQIKELSMIENQNTQIVDFEFSKYPEFLNSRDEFNKLGAYAWKSAIINDCLNKFTDHYLIWNDAGNLLLSDLSRLKTVLHKYGFYSPRSNGTIEEWTHVKTINKFKLSDNDKIKKKPNLTGGLVGLKTSSLKSKELIKQWFHYSMKEEYISPEGSNRDNHRQDQSLLSIIFYKNFENIKNPKTKKFFQIAVNQNPGKILYILDSKDDKKVEFKKDVLKKYPLKTINTISATKYVWVLDVDDYKIINKKIINSKKFIINISKESEFDVVKKILYKNMKDIIFVFEDELLIEKLKYLNNEGNVILVDDFLDISETTNKILEIVS
tara:strand:+ start:188 stop:1390 length:1203 start_codon:yes stop_codon:yes gene_type:complete